MVRLPAAQLSVQGYQQKDGIASRQESDIILEGTEHMLMASTDNDMMTRVGMYKRRQMSMMLPGSL